MILYMLDSVQLSTPTFNLFHCIIAFYGSVNDIFGNNNINNIITYTHNTKRFLLAEDTDDTGVT